GAGSFWPLLRSREPAPSPAEPTLRVHQGATHGAPEHTSTTAPPVCKKSDFCVRALGELRGSECGSGPVDGAVFVVGGVLAPLSHTISAEPSKGSVGMAGMP